MDLKTENGKKVKFQNYLIARIAQANYVQNAGKIITKIK